MERLIFPPVKRVPFLSGDSLSSIWDAFLRKVMQRADDGYFAGQVAQGYPSSDLTITGRASDAAAVIGAHTRVYPSGSKSLEGGTVASLSYGTTYYLHYADPSREGGLVTYQATTDWTAAFPTATDPNRHFLGKLTMPASAGASNTTGTPARPPGWV